MYLRAIVETSQCFIYKGTFAPALKVKKNSYKEDEQLDIEASYFTASFADDAELRI
jgi:hypothetical protein